MRRDNPSLPVPFSTCVRKGSKKDGSFMMGPWAPAVECVSSLLNQVYHSLESCGSLAMTAKVNLHGRGYLMPRLDARQAVRLLNSQRDAGGYAGKRTILVVDTTLWLLKNQGGREKGRLQP